MPSTRTELSLVRTFRQLVEPLKSLLSAQLGKPGRSWVTFASFGALVWAGLLALDAALQGGFAQEAVQRAVLVLQIGVRQVLTLTVALGLVHGVEVVVTRWSRRYASGAAWLVAMGAGTLVCWQQAAFLTSGDGVSGHRWIELIRVALFVLLSCGVALLYTMTRRVLTLPGLSSPWQWALGALALALFGLSTQYFHLLHAYAFFAMFLTFCLAALVASATAAVLRPRPEIGIGIVTALAVFSVVANRSESWLSVSVLEGAPLSVAARRGVGPESDVANYTFDFDETDADCDTSHESRPKSHLGSADVRRNVILISVDAWRDDTIHRKERGRLLMPAVSAFAKRSLEFEHAFSPYPATIYALGSAFSGYSPSELLLAPRVPDNLFRLAATHVERVELVLPASGWFKMDAIDKLLTQGSHTTHATDATKQTQIAIELLEDFRQKGQRSLLWVHYFAPHDPYERHRKFNFGMSKRDLYFGEVAYVDKAIGDLLQHLDQEKWLADSLVLLFADHGEALGEHDYFGHHVFLEKPIIDVPMILHYPGVVPGRGHSVVELGDVLPTVLEFLDAEVPADINARSLFQALENPAPRSSVSEAFPLRGKDLFRLADAPIDTVAQLRSRAEEVREQGARSYDPKVALVKGDYRLVVSRRTGDGKLYDRRSDERENVRREQPDIYEDMKQELAEWHVRTAERIRCRLDQK
jgi:choline-sulfatase